MRAAQSDCISPTCAISFSQLVSTARTVIKLSSSLLLVNMPCSVTSPHTSETHCCTHLLLLQEREQPGLTDWDRFAKVEYARLAMEEEGQEQEPQHPDLWDNTDAAF